MKVEDLYLIGLHHAAFRCGEPALITGLKKVSPDGRPGRLCYEVKYSDQTVDQVAVSDVVASNYVIVTLEQILNPDTWKPTHTPEAKVVYMSERPRA